MKLFKEVFQITMGECRVGLRTTIQIITYLYCYTHHVKLWTPKSMMGHLEAHGYKFEKVEHVKGVGINEDEEE